LNEQINKKKILKKKNFVCLCRDLSRGKEHNPVRLVSNIDNVVVPKFKYITARENASDLQDLIEEERQLGRYDPVSEVLFPQWIEKPIFFFFFSSSVAPVRHVASSAKKKFVHAARIPASK
jgi:hypothetical protein